MKLDQTRISVGEEDKLDNNNLGNELDCHAKLSNT